VFVLNSRTCPHSAALTTRATTVTFVCECCRPEARASAACGSTRNYADKDEPLPAAKYSSYCVARECSIDRVSRARSTTIFSRLAAGSSYPHNYGRSACGGCSSFWTAAFAQNVTVVARVVRRRNADKSLNQDKHLARPGACVRVRPRRVELQNCVASIKLVD